MPRLELEIDGDGYPTNDTLLQIMEYEGDHEALLSAIRDVYPAYGSIMCDRGGTWKMTTGGWSGCEDIIGAMQSNTIFWFMCWQLSKRGGYYEFKVRMVMP